MPKAKPPKKIWIRSLSHGYVSIAEYIRNQRRSICDPIKLGTPRSEEKLKELQATLSVASAAEQRPFVAVVYPSDMNAKDVARMLGLAIQSY